MTLLLILLDAVPVRIPDFASIAPALPLISVFYWAIFRPDLMNPFVAVILGVLNDIIAGTPLGVSSLVYLVTQGICASQRRFFSGKPFRIAWWGFSMVAAGALAIQWFFVSALYARIMMPQPAMFELLLTIAFYPVLSWALTRVQLMVLNNA